MKMLLIDLLKQECGYCKKLMKKYFNKNLIMTEKIEEDFQSSNTCWICEKLIEDEKLRDHCRHIPGKYRGVVHWSFNVNLKLTNKVLLIFHNLKDYDSDLVMNQIGKCNVKVDVIPNEPEQYMVLTIDKNF